MGDAHQDHPGIGSRQFDGIDRRAVAAVAAVAQSGKRQTDPDPLVRKKIAHARKTRRTLRFRLLQSLPRPLPPHCQLPAGYDLEVTSGRDDFTADLRGEEYFPFDLPTLAFYSRGVELGKMLSAIVAPPDFPQKDLRQPREFAIGNCETLAPRAPHSPASPGADHRPSAAHHEETNSRSRPAGKHQANNPKNGAYG